jgi:hypothetical protein
MYEITAPRAGCFANHEQRDQLITIRIEKINQRFATNVACGRLLALRQYKRSEQRACTTFE